MIIQRQTPHTIRYSPGIDIYKQQEYDTVFETYKDSKGNYKVVERKLETLTNQFINLKV